MKTLTLPLSLAALSLLAMPSHAHAQEAPIVRPSERVVIAFSEHPEWVDVQALARRLSGLADVEIVGAERASTAAMLSVEWHTPNYARIAITRPDGSITARLVELPNDATERVETMAILATNLLRDESTELLAMLRRSPEAVAETRADQAAEAEPSPPVLVLVEAETPSTPAQAYAVDAPEPLEVEEEERAAPSSPFLRLGLGAELGSVPRGTGLEVDTLSGLELAWTAPEWLALGVRNLNVAAVSNRTVHVDFAPFVEGRVSFDFLALYGQLGAHLQVDGDGRVGGAAMGVLGARFRVVPEFSMGLETALRVVVTDTFDTSTHTLPQWSIPWTGGLVLLFHVS